MKILAYLALGIVMFVASWLCFNNGYSIPGAVAGVDAGLAFYISFSYLREEL